MFSSFQRLLGQITVKEKGDLIFISGLPADVIVKNIYRQWSTTKIAEFMFNSVSKSAISFNKFFALDFVYTLKTLCKERPRYSNVRALQKVIDEMYLHTWLKDIDTPKTPILNREKLKALNVNLLSHQEDFLNIYEKNVPAYNLKGYLLAAEPGTGKTISSLSLSLCLDADVTICVVPKNSLDRVWGETLDSRFVKPPSYWSSSKESSFTSGKKYYLLHYERLAEAVEFFKTQKYNNPVILLDECHNLNDMDSLRTQKFIELCTVLNSKHVLWFSGTPVKAIGNEVMPLLKTIDGFFDEDAEVRFRKIFGKNAAKAVDILRNRLGLVSFKVSKNNTVKHETFNFDKKIKIPNGDLYTLEHIKSVMSQFIKNQMKYYESNMGAFVSLYNRCLSIHEKTFTAAIQKEQFRVYNNYIRLIRNGYNPETMKQEVIYCNKYELQQIVPSLPKELREDFKNCRSVIKYYTLKVQGEALGRILGKQRTQCHVDMVRYSGIEVEIENSIKKTIVFTSYVEVANETKKYLTELGFKPMIVYGDTNKDLAAIIGQFDKDEDINPLIATYQSLSTAVPLTMANTVICMNSPFRIHELEQAVARASRIGQTEDVNVFHVLLDTGEEPNISTRSNDILKWSEEMVGAIMGTPVTDIALETILNDSIKDVFSNRVLSEKPSWVSW
jgi:SNF2 family DNA or RNA helicase